MAVVGKATVRFNNVWKSLGDAALQPLLQYEEVGEESGQVMADRVGAQSDPVLRKFSQDSADRAGTLAAKNIISGITEPLKTRMRIQGAFIGDEIGESVAQGGADLLNNKDWLSSPAIQQIIGEARGERERDIEWDFIPRKPKEDNESVEDQQAKNPAGDPGRSEAAGKSIGQRFTQQWDRHFQQRSPAPFEAMIKMAAAKFTEFQITQALFIGGASAIMAAVNSMVAFAAGAGHALAGFAALGNIFGSLIQGLLVGKSVFSGIGAAIKAQEKVTQKATQSALDAAQQAMQVARARFNLKRETLQNSRASEDAFRKVERAERRYIKSMEKERKARERLEDARDRAAERIQDMKLAMEGAGLSEERAVLNVKKAEDALREARSGGTANEIYEADLAYRETELELRQIREANVDLLLESQEVYAKGVENDDAVLDGMEAVDDAAREAADALREAIRAAEDAPLSIESAALQLQGALLALQKALQPPNQTALDGLADAMDDLSPAAQRFVRYWTGTMQPMLKDIRKAGQEKFFPGLQRGLESMRNGGFFGVIKNMVVGTSGVLGRFTERLGATLVEPENLGALNKIFGSNTGILASIGRMVTSMVKPLLTLGAAIAPYAEKMALRWEGAAQDFANFIDQADASGELDSFFAGAEQRLLALKEMFKAFGPGLWEVLKAAGSAADVFIAGVTKMGEEWSITVIENGRTKTTKTFEDSVSNFLKILDAAGALGGFAFRMGNLPGMDKLFVGTGENLPFLLDILNIILEDFTDDIVRLIYAVADLSSALAASQVLNVFTEVVSHTFAILGAFASWPPVLIVIATYLTVKGVSKGISLAIGFFDSFKGSLNKIKEFKDDWRSVFREPRTPEQKEGLATLTHSLVAMFEGRGAKLLREFGPKFKQAGKDFCQGAIQAMAEGIDRVKEAVKILGMEALQDFRSYLDISSPSMLAYRITLEEMEKILNEIMARDRMDPEGAAPRVDIDTTGTGSETINGMATSVTTATEEAERVAKSVADGVVFDPPMEKVGVSAMQSFSKGKVERSGHVLAIGKSAASIDSVSTDEHAKRGGKRAEKRGFLEWLRPQANAVKAWAKVGASKGKIFMKTMAMKLGTMAKAVIGMFMSAWKYMFGLFAKWAAGAAAAGKALRTLIRNALTHGTKKFPLPKAVKESLEKKFGKDVMEKGLLKSMAGVFWKKALELIEKKLGKKVATKLAATGAGLLAGGIPGIIIGIGSAIWTAWDVAMMTKDLWDLWREVQNQKEITDEEFDRDYLTEDVVTDITKDYDYGEISPDLDAYLSGYALGGMVKKQYHLRLNEAARKRYAAQFARQHAQSSMSIKRAAQRKDAQVASLRAAIENEPSMEAKNRLMQRIQGTIHGFENFVRHVKRIPRVRHMPRTIQRFALGGLVQGLNIPAWLLDPTSGFRYDSSLNNLPFTPDWTSAQKKRLLEILYAMEKYAYLKNDSNKDLFEKALEDAINNAKPNLDAQKTALQTAMDRKRVQMELSNYGLTMMVDPAMAGFMQTLIGGGLQEYEAMTKEIKYDAMGMVMTVTGGDLEAASLTANYIDLTAEFEAALWEAYQVAFNQRIKEQQEAERQRQADEAAETPSGEPLPPSAPPDPNDPRKDEGLWYYPLREVSKESTYKDHKPAGSFDVRAAQGTDIYPVHPGEVIKVVKNVRNPSQYPNGSFGNYVKIFHPDAQVSSLYAHMFSKLVDSNWAAEGLPALGQKVYPYTRIGRVGQSGNTKGAHLHMSMYQGSKGGEVSINAHTYLKKKGVRMGTPFLAEGGVIRATPGGIQVILGEAGRDERIDPLNAHGQTEAGNWVARALEILTDDEEFDIHMENHIHESTKPDIPVLAERFSREIMFIR